MLGKYTYTHVRCTSPGLEVHESVSASLYMPAPAGSYLVLTDLSVPESPQQLFGLEHVLCMLLFIDTDRLQ